MSTRRNSTTDKRQKSQYSLAFPEESRGAAPTAFEGGTESEMAKRTAESPATEQWMEEVCEPDADPHVRSCGRGGEATLPPMPIPLGLGERAVPATRCDCTLGYIGE